MQTPSQICYLCGVVLNNSNKTRDHVPPRGLFPRPLPSNLITVPCCRPCNGAKSDEEEFFRLIATLGTHRTAEAETVYQQRTLPRTLMRRRLKSAVAQLVASSEHRWMNSKGVFSRVAMAKVPIAPLKSVAERIARGLTAHFHPALVVHQLRFETWLPQQGKLLEAFALLGENLTELRIGGRTFHAYHGTTVESGAVGIWLMTFHERIAAAVLHYDKEHAGEFV